MEEDGCPASPHMRLAVQSGLAPRHLIIALREANTVLVRASVLAEFWDSHDERDAWAKSNLPETLFPAFSALHSWCEEQSLDWARGVVHPASVKSADAAPVTAQRSLSPPVGYTKKAQYSSIPLRHFSLTSSHNVEDSGVAGCTPKALPRKSEHEQHLYDNAFKTTVGLAEAVADASGLMCDLRSSHLSMDEQSRRLHRVVLARAPASGTLRSLEALAVGTRPWFEWQLGSIPFWQPRSGNILGEFGV